MVNEEFKREVERLFSKGLKEAVEQSVAPSDITIKETSKLNDEHGEEFFLLTVSSQLFRLFIVLHFTQNEDSKTYVSHALNIGLGAITDENFNDYLGEVGNAFCGSIKRNLNKTVPHLGMSTPNKLGKDCLPYLDAFKVDSQSHAVVEYQGTPLFHASAYISADEELNYEIPVNIETETEADSGELEFF